MGRKSKQLKVKRTNKTEEQQKSVEEISQNAADAKFKYSSDELLDKADEFLETFDYDMARRFCQRALEVDKLNCRGLEMSGLLFLQANEVDLAINCYQKAVELQPNSGHVKYMYLGQLSTGIEAVKHYLKGVELMNARIAEFKTSQAAESADAGENTEGASAKSKEATCEITQRDVSNAYCAVAEIFLTDACFEDDAESRCKESLDKAIEADSENPEGFHLLASFWLSKDDKEKATEAINRGISLWLPQLRAADQPEGTDPVQPCQVGFSARVNCCKTLIELANYEVASEILELLLDEDDEVVEVWYLLGWINYLQGEDFKANARHYLQKGIELAAKQHFEDEQMVGHLEELMAELGPAVEEENVMDDEKNSSESEDEESENQDNGEEAMEH